LIPVGVGNFVEKVVLTAEVGVEGILEFRSNVGVFEDRDGLELEFFGILTGGSACTLIGGKCNASNCCGTARLAGSVCRLTILSLDSVPDVVPRFLPTAFFEDEAWPSVLLLLSLLLLRGGGVLPSSKSSFGAVILTIFLSEETLFVESFIIDEGTGGIINGGTKSFDVDLGCGNKLGGTDDIGGGS
jgi:hypothetical protein